MASEAEPLQYTTTVLRVPIHCEGCKKKVKKVLHSIEGVYKVTIDGAQHKVTVTGSVAANALIRRLHKSGKQAVLWPVPAAVEAKKPEEVATEAAPADGKDSKGADKAEEKPKEAAQEAESESSEKDKKKPEKDMGSEKKPEKAEQAKTPKEEAKKDSEVAEKEKGSPEPAKEAAAEDETGGKKGKKKKKKQKDSSKVDAAAEKPPQPQPTTSVLAPPPGPSPYRPDGLYPYYGPPPVMSYNMTHPSTSMSYYATTPVGSMHPMPPPPSHVPYGYSPYPPMMMMPPPPEFLYGPPGMRSSPPQESYNFEEENPYSCSLM